MGRRVCVSRIIVFIDNLRWVATGSDVNQVVAILERCTAKSIEWGSRRGHQFDTAKTEATLFTRGRGNKNHLRPKLTAKIRVGDGFLRFNSQATRWLGVWMDVHLTLKVHHNQCMTKARAAEARLRTRTRTYGVVPESVTGVQLACVKSVTLHGCELWWDPNEAGRRDDHQLLLNRQARSILGELPTTPRGTSMRDSGLTPTPLILESRQQRFAARLANMCSNELRKLLQNASSGAPVCRAVKNEHEHGQTTEGMTRPPPGEESVVRTVILDNASALKRAAPRWAREKEAKVGVGVWMWWTDGLRSDVGRVGAAAVCKHHDKWGSRRSYLGTERMQVVDAELWAIGLALMETSEKRALLQRNGVNMVVVFSDSQGAIQQAPHLKPGPGQQLATRINRQAQALLAQGIKTEIHWVPGHSGIPGKEDADRQANVACEARADTATKQPYTSATNPARRISERRSAAKATREADKCSQHFGYRLKGRAGTKRPMPMTSMKSLAARIYRLKSRHAPTGVYLKWFGHREDDICWWCCGGGRTAAQTREHLFRHCSR